MHSSPDAASILRCSTLNSLSTGPPSVQKSPTVAKEITGFPLDPCNIVLNPSPIKPIL